MHRTNTKLTRPGGIILDVDGAAALLGVSRYTIYRLIKKNELPSTRVGREWRFHRPTLIQWVAAGSNANHLQHIFKSARLKKK